MRMCQVHWEAMRKAIDDRGLTPLVSKDGEAAMQIMKDQVSGEPAAFDPLMAMNWNFMSAAIHHGGLEVMGVDPATGEDYCPLCLAKSKGEVQNLDQAWISDCADEMLKHARDNKLIPGPQ